MKIYTAKILNSKTLKTISSIVFENISKFKKKLNELGYELGYELGESAIQMDIDLFLIAHPNYKGGILISSSSIKGLTIKTNKIVAEMIDIIKLNKGL